MLLTLCNFWVRTKVTDVQARVALSTGWQDDKVRVRTVSPGGCWTRTAKPESPLHLLITDKTNRVSDLADP